MKVCILTTSFPRFPGDYASVFVYDLAAELVAAGMEVCVIAPIEAGSLYHEVIRGVEVHRFAYFWPVRWQRIAYLGGIPDNLRRYRAAWLQLPFFLLSFFLSIKSSILGYYMFVCKLHHYSLCLGNKLHVQLLKNLVF